jgi:hypothetical protein
MFSLRPSRRVATFAVVAGLLAVAAPAGASAADVQPGPRGIVTDNKDPDKLAFSGDASDAGLTLMADMGGQFSRTPPSADGIIAVLTGL